jgi:hypothetical protein
MRLSINQYVAALAFDCEFPLSKKSTGHNWHRFVVLVPAAVPALFVARTTTTTTTEKESENYLY